MGNCLGKTKPQVQSQYKTPDEKVRTILRIKQQRDKISQKRDAVMKSVSQAHQKAVQCRKNGQKDQAIYYLGKKKLQQKNLQQINNKLTLVENSIQTLEQTMDDVEFTQTLKKNNELIRDLRDQVDTEAIVEANELNKEIDFNSQQIQNFINEQETDQDLLDEYENLGNDNQMMQIIKGDINKNKIKITNLFQHTNQINNMKNLFKITRRLSGLDLTSNSLKETASAIKQMNRIIEFQPALSLEEKASRKRFLIYRSDPSNPEDVPKLMSYYVDLNDCGPMYLDALIYIKDKMDQTLSFRRSCREGVCGSCAMNMEGQHKLACIHPIDKNLSDPCHITPLGHMFVIKDLVVDMTNFYAQYRSIEPFLKRKTPKEQGQKEYYQSEEDRALLDGLYECVLCASCSTSCPSYWWKPDKYLGPAVLMQAYRWVIDSRDEYQDERLEQLSQGVKLDGCENIGICTLTCPKDLNPQHAIQKLRELVSQHQLKKRDTDIV